MISSRSRSPAPRALTAVAILLVPCLAARLPCQEPEAAPPDASETTPSPREAAPQAPVRPPAGPVALKGRILDGSTMVRSSRPPPTPPGHDHPADQLAGVARIPLPNRKFMIHLIDGPGRGKTWEGTADGEGRFTLLLGENVPLPGPCLVAVVGGAKTLYSPAVPWAPGEVEFRSYPTTESDQFLQSGVEVQHSLAKDPVQNRLVLEVEFRLMVRNLGPEMYIGRPRPDRQGERSSAAREIFRAPLPAEAVVLPTPSASRASWTEAPAEGDWKWMLLDTPIPPSLEESQRFGVWAFRYRVPARQSSVTVYPMGFNILQFGVSGGSEDLILSLSRISPPSPPDSEKRLTDVLSDLEAGSKVALEARVDNALLGQPNYGSLMILGGFLLAAVLAVIAGLLLGRKGPSLEAVLEEASGDEIIARIAQLDQKHDRGEIPNKEYQETRSRLLSLARYVVSELAAGGAAASGSSGAEEGAVLPRAAQDLLARLRSLEAEGPLDAGRIHERAILLEELAKALSVPAGPRDRKEKASGR